MEHQNKYKSLLVSAGIFFLMLMVSQSCYYDNEEELYPETLQNCDTTSNVTYTNKIQVITSNSCAISGCHTGATPTGGLNLDTYQQVKSIAENGRLGDRVLVNEDMPPSGPLSHCEMEYILTWINNGAPE